MSLLYVSKITNNYKSGFSRKRKPIAQSSLFAPIKPLVSLIFGIWNIFPRGLDHFSFLDNDIVLGHVTLFYDILYYVTLCITLLLYFSK